MQGQEDDTEKSHEPTPKKKEDARKKGDVAKSQDLNTTAAYFGLVIGLLLAGGSAVLDATSVLSSFLSRPEDYFGIFNGSPTATLNLAVPRVAPLLSYVFGIPALFVIASILSQRSMIFAPNKLAPKMSKLSLVKNAKQKFGVAGLFEFFKSFVKLIVISTCLMFFVRVHLEEIVSLGNFVAKAVVGSLLTLFVQFLVIVFFVSAAIGVIDYLFQVGEHNRKLRMSRKEVMDENKESEGDPHFKGQRRQRGRDIALSQTLERVADADVVITNPTHFAIALHWNKTPGTAPICVAKGVDETAKAIRQRSIEAGVPIHEDPPTARALCSTTSIDQEIPPDLYQAVATAIRFADAMRLRMKQRGY